jgi:hypothetical protein
LDIKEYLIVDESNMARNDFFIPRQPLPVATSATPSRHPDCCLSLSPTIPLDIIKAFPSRDALVLSIGSGTGLLEAIMAVAEPRLWIEGVEVRSVNKYLPDELVHTVQGTWQLCSRARDCDALLFVYPRDPGLVKKYIADLGFLNKVQSIIWIGPVNDWAEFAKCFEGSQYVSMPPVHISSSELLTVSCRTHWCQPPVEDARVESGIVFNDATSESHLGFTRPNDREIKMLGDNDASPDATLIDEHSSTRDKGASKPQSDRLHVSKDKRVGDTELLNQVAHLVKLVVEYYIFTEERFQILSGERRKRKRARYIGYSDADGDSDSDFSNTLLTKELKKLKSIVRHCGRPIGKENPKSTASEQRDQSAERRWTQPIGDSNSDEAEFIRNCKQ